MTKQAKREQEARLRRMRREAAAPRRAELRVIFKNIDKLIRQANKMLGKQ
jgi:hypothetical protein